jgi:hypothetical protein
LKLVPSGQSRRPFRAADGERQGSTISVPAISSTLVSTIRRRNATCPSYSSPWLPPQSTTVGPSPFLKTAIGTARLPHALSSS